MELDEHVNRASPHGQVVAGSTAAFTSNVSGQQLLDVQNSTLFAQLAADKKYPKGEQVKDWYDFYVQVLGKLGWVKQDFHFTKYKSQQASFKLSEVTLELLRALIGGNEELLSVVKATLDNLAKSQDGLILFSNNSTSSNNGRFQILPCTVTNDQISDVVIDIFSEALKVDRVEKGALKDTIKSIEKYKTALALFESSSIESNRGNFHILAFTVDKNEQISTSLLGCYFPSTEIKEDFFFTKREKQDITL
ncbi:hypothetical protein AWC38_SpisGene21696 [Stylophora pistillata]|uniref:Uncharacterized protein n=1 Tax=Stylophora pistillata TaxID=50429 RepID=A0A2B4RD51_STYPI|nr:hypothetical protein AWC38_SpisGene21696 [Stylophora pistillata]